MELLPARLHFPALCLLGIILAARPADALDSSKALEGIVGGGIRTEPVYEGADTMSTEALPAVDLTWKGRAFLNLDDGLGFYVVQFGGFEAGASVNFNTGREDSASPDLAGLGDINGTMQAEILADYSWQGLTVAGWLKRDLGASQGFQAGIALSTDIPLSDRVIISAETGATWADSAYTGTWFGITPAQSLASTLPVFNAEAGWKSIRTSLGATYLMTDHWLLRAEAGSGWLLGSAAESPITDQRVVPFFQLGIAYRF